MWHWAAISVLFMFMQCTRARETQSRTQRIQKDTGKENLEQRAQNTERRAPSTEHRAVRAISTESQDSLGNSVFGRRRRMQLAASPQLPFSRICRKLCMCVCVCVCEVLSPKYHLAYITTPKAPESRCQHRFCCATLPPHFAAYPFAVRRLPLAFRLRRLFVTYSIFRSSS